MKILSIDGGGIRGIIPATVLADLERRTGRRTARLFDLIAGTSTGGILAAALTVPGARPAAELVDLYRTEGHRIFQTSLWQRVVSAQGLTDARHDPEALEAVLREYLGDWRLEDATTRLLATAYDTAAREAYFFKSWRADGEPERSVPMTVVARGTSAAPTYFPPEAVPQPRPLHDLSLIDGGVFANNPAMCAYAEAMRLEPGGTVRLVSLGTGSQTHPLPYEEIRHWGVVEWARPIIDVVFDGVADTVDYQLRHLLGERYTRLQCELRHGASDALDDADAANIRALVDVAETLVSAQAPVLDALAAELTA